MREMILLLLSALITGELSTGACAFAMGARPREKTRAEPEEFVSPEIEIITRPEQNIQILSGKQPAVPPVSPAEILPAAGADPEAIAKNARVIDIQTALKNAGYDPGPIDGKMGPRTKKAVTDFQKANNLTVDGIVGPKTWGALHPYLQTPPSAGKSR